MNTTEALQNFLSAIENYKETGVWPDNHTLRALADCGLEALKKSPDTETIAQLRAENARLREALANCVKEMMGDGQCRCPKLPMHVTCDHCKVIVEARAALATPEGKADEPLGSSTV